jgi:glycosyltransferase involved in cell wall biosynthesis/predicted SAM-dependent methyltransferase
MDVSRVEEVDVVWRSGPIADAFPAGSAGTFDGLIASHVGEHVPDLIGFFQSADRLLKPNGIIALALPDRRVAMDYLRPVTLTGDLLEAHRLHPSRHSLKNRFNFAAYAVRNGDKPGWGHNENLRLHFMGSLHDAYHGAVTFDPTSEASYEDIHAWVFSPRSFELIVKECHALGLIPWMPTAIESASGVEFYVWLSRQSHIPDHRSLESQRLALLHQIAIEGKPNDGQCQTVTSVSQPRPTISVVIPLYNGAHYIERALQSVFRQTLPPDEIILVDDGSTDNGIEIVGRMNAPGIVRLLRKANGGQSEARNHGVAYSSGEIISFLDQDDVWYPDHLATLVTPFGQSRRRPLGWVYSNVDHIDDAGDMVSHSFLSNLPTRHPKTSVAECIRHDMFVLPSASLILRKAFDAVGGFDIRLSGYEDDDLFLRLFRAGYDNAYINEALSQWRIYSTSSSYTPQMDRSGIIYARKLFALFPDEPTMHHYYSSDLLVPRFFHTALRRYKTALEGQNNEQVVLAQNDIEFIIDHMRPSMTRARLSIILKLLRSPTVARCAFDMRAPFRWAMRYALKLG